MYRINNIKNYLKCPRYHYLNCKDLDDKTTTHLRNDFSVTKLLLLKYKIGKFLLGKRNDSNEVFFKNINNFNWFAKIRLEFDNLRIKIPLMHKVNDNVFDLYYFQPISNIKIEDPIYYASHIQILKKFEIEVNKIVIITVSNTYLKKGEYDFEQLLIENDTIFDSKTKTFKPIINYVKTKQKFLNTIIDQMKNHSENDFRVTKSKKCFYKGKCRYFDVCFKEEIYPDNSILTLVQSQYKNEMFNYGIKTLKEARLDKIEGSAQQFAQIMADKMGGFYQDKLGLKLWFNTIKKHPISFLDFEWDSFLIPPYDGMSSFSTMCFEYSLHTLKSDGSLSHHCYIGQGDCRKEFITDLLSNISKNGSILAYNANGAEILRLKELAQQFPQFEKDINQLIERFVDLASPFASGLLYDIRMKGSYSIKTLIEVVSDLSYDNLMIKDGMEAVEVWRLIDKNQTNQEQKLLDALKTYCSFDTYSMYEVYLWLEKIVKNN